MSTLYIYIYIYVHLFLPPSLPPSLSIVNLKTGPTGTGSNADQGNADAASAVLVGGPEPQHRKRRSIIEKAKKHTLTSNLILNDIYQEVVVQDNEDGVTDDDFFKGILEPDL